MYVGIDIIEIQRIGLTYSRYPVRFLEKIYTTEEQKYCRGRAPQLASRFAAKEAVAKSLGARPAFYFKRIEILNKDTGQLELSKLTLIQIIQNLATYLQKIMKI